MREELVVCLLLCVVVQVRAYPLALHGSQICAKYQGQYKRFDNMSALLEETNESGKRKYEILTTKKTLQICFVF